MHYLRPAAESLRRSADGRRAHAEIAMPIRPEVSEFVALGPLPAASASEEVIARHERSLASIQGPVSDDEAALLITSFGPDDCYGVAWTLLHLIESAPGGVPVAAEPALDANEWLRRLWARSHR